MKMVKGNMLENINPEVLTVLLHGCNCFHTMGAGVASQIANRWPKVLEVDKQTVKGVREKLGSNSYVRINDKLIIVNCYTQFTYGVYKRQVNYEAIYNCFEDVAIYLQKYDLSKIDMRAPMIGCGLAGGDWNIIRPIFNKLLHHINIYYF
jgi:O-acetyl-ADP-ribose deacetylase (regulator of RNase III)